MSPFYVVLVALLLALAGNLLALIIYWFRHRPGPKRSA